MSTYRKGQIVEIVHDDYPDLKVVGKIRLVNLHDEIYVDGWGWIGVRMAGRGITVLAEPPRPVYENVTRDPVIGDVYLFGAADRVIPVQWQVDKDNLDDYRTGRRVLIFDGLRNETIPGVSW